MKFASISTLILFSGANAFSITERKKTHVINNNGAFSSSVVLNLSSSPDYEERMKQLMREEAMNSANMKQSAEQLKNMTPQDIERMISEMDSMPAAQAEQMKAMGMDVGMMKNAMQMMKSNPAMMDSMAKMMEKMTPEQLMEQSKLAQQQMANMSQQNQAVSTPPTANVVDVDDTDDEEDIDDTDDEEGDDEDVATTPEILDTMFRVGEIMSDPQDGGVTFEAFLTLPPISVLMGDGSEDCLSRREVKECWANGAKDPSRTSRVDRAGFEKVWNEVQDEFYNNIIEESVERSKKKTGKKIRSGSAEKSTSPPTPTTPVVGANIDPALLKDRLKNLSDDDVSGMFDQMNNMTPEQEARMRAMNVDPEMMKKSAEMMKSNPLLRKAATMMMKNSSPEQLMKASQQAQEKIANMSDEDKKKMMDNLK